MKKDNYRTLLNRWCKLNAHYYAALPEFLNPISHGYSNFKDYKLVAYFKVTKLRNCKGYEIEEVPNNNSIEQYCKSYLERMSAYDNYRKQYKLLDFNNIPELKLKLAILGA